MSDLQVLASSMNRWIVGTLVVVGVVGATPAAGAETLTVRCTQDGTELGAGEVSARADGVHLNVQMVFGTQTVRVTDHDSTTFLTAGSSSPYTVDVAPGVRVITCYDPQNPAQEPGTPGFAARSAAVRVIDPAGHFVSPTLTCARGVATRFEDPLPRVDGRRLRFALRMRVPGIQSTDIAERAGYPAARHRQVRLRRGGRIIATTQFSPAAGDKWVMHRVSVCREVVQSVTVLRGTSAGVRVTMSLGSNRPPAVVVSIDRRVAGGATLKVLRRPHTVTCRTPRVSYSGTARMSAIDTNELLFGVRRLPTSGAYRCTLTARGVVVRSIGLRRV